MVVLERDRSPCQLQGPAARRLRRRCTWRPSSPATTVVRPRPTAKVPAGAATARLTRRARAAERPGEGRLCGGARAPSPCRVSRLSSAPQVAKRPLLMQMSSSSSFCHSWTNATTAKNAARAGARKQLPPSRYGPLLAREPLPERAPYRDRRRRLLWERLREQQRQYVDPPAPIAGDRTSTGDWPRRTSAATSAPCTARSFPRGCRSSRSRSGPRLRSRVLGGPTAIR